MSDISVFSSEYAWKSPIKKDIRINGTHNFTLAKHQIKKRYSSEYRLMEKHVIFIINLAREKEITIDEAFNILKNRQDFVERKIK